MKNNNPILPITTSQINEELLYLQESGGSYFIARLKESSFEIVLGWIIEAKEPILLILSGPRGSDRRFALRNAHATWINRDRITPENPVALPDSKRQVLTLAIAKKKNLELYPSFRGDRTDFRTPIRTYKLTFARL